MPIQSAQQLLLHELRAIEDAEKQASQALQQIKSQLENRQVEDLVDRRLKQGEQVLRDVQECLSKLDGGSSGSVRNKAAQGLIQEATELLKEVEAPEMKQAVIIGGAQKLEHYCIAAWGTVKAMAQETGQRELVQAMDRALKEGYEWDREMTKMAESRVNPAALGEGDEPRSGSSGENQSKEGGQSGGSPSDDLKAREYRGDDGQIHHHTREYMERQKS